MATSRSPLSAASFTRFGDLLRYLRTRARLTQRELSIAVGYSEAQISRLEHHHRPADLATIAALFVPALDLQEEPEFVTRLLELAAEARGEAPPAHLSITRTIEHALNTDVGTNPAHALPSARTSFVGRDGESAEVMLALAQGRLVTLTGAGGSGKTRLSLHVASQLAASFADGVCFVPLAPIDDAALVPTAVATALELPAREGKVTDALAQVLQPRHMLLVLDNCEHVVEAVADLAAALLAACPRLRLLATSREPLDLPDEAVYRLAPLQLPERSAESYASIAESPAVQLFTARAAAALPGFELSGDNAPAVAQICRRLDGMPLAIELAAARMTLLTSQQIAERLDDRFRLLTAGKHAEPRHRSLRLALDWSYELLEADERTLFARLSVFSGGWSVEAMEQVCGDEGGAQNRSRDDASSLDLLEQLVDQSLVTVERHGDTPARFSMLESVREYAREKLEERSEAAVLRQRHLRYFAGFFEEAAPQLRRHEQRAWLARFDADHDNARAALGFACACTDEQAAEQGYGLALALSHYWWVRGLAGEGNTWMQRLLAIPQQPHASGGRARVLALSIHWAPPEQQRQRFDESLALAGAAGDVAGLAFAHLQYGLLGWSTIEVAKALEALNESLAHYRALGDAAMVVTLLAELAEFEQVRLNNRLAAEAHFAESLEHARELGDTRNIALALAHLGDLALEHGDLAATEAYCAEALGLAHELGDLEAMSWCLEGLSIAAYGAGRSALAIQLGEESVRLSREWSHDMHVVIRSYWLARAVLQAGDTPRAMHLFEETLALGRRLSFDWGVAVASHGLGDIALARGDVAAARGLFREALALLHAGNYGYSLAYVLDAFAALHAVEGAWQRAAEALGAADALRARTHSALLPVEYEARRQLIATLRVHLGEALFEAAHRRGAILAPDAVMHLAG
jgi:predicted ATPase/transcriptional regulator with XRE-family HTH domain/tetratricopeptide (TPR) repeat protein